MSGNVTDIDEKRRKKRKSKIKRKNIIKLIVLTAVIGYFLTRAIPVALSSYIETETVEKEVFIDDIETTGIVLKDEILYDSGSGNIELKKEEGDRVGKGELLAVSRTDDFSSKKEELSAIDKEIALYGDLLNEYNWLKSLDGSEEKAIEDYIEHLKGKLSLDESRLNSIKSDIVNGTDTNEKYFSEEVDRLNKQKAEVEKSLQSGEQTYAADTPGIVSYTVDGFEENISTDMLDKLDYSKYNGIKEKIASGKGQEPTSGLKIVEGHRWYLMMDVEKAYGKELEEKGSLEVAFKDMDYTLTGSVEKLEVDERTLIVLEFDEGLHKVYNQREVDISIVKGRYSGLRVPSSAITESGGERGVYIKEISGIVKFIPVRLLYKGKEHSIVNEEEQGLIETKIDGKTEEVRALQVFDEVFKNSILVRENQVIN